MVTSARQEKAALRLSRTAVSLHFVERMPEDASAEGGAAIPTAYPNCAVFRSMELDLLSYQYQVRPPLGSRCETHGRAAVEILFPATFDYHSEGRTIPLHCGDPVRPAEVMLSSTSFLAGGVRIWHCTFVPPEGGAFSEFDIIKLIHLYDGRTEQTGLAELVQFRLADGSVCTIRDLPSRIAGHPISAELKAGTVELIHGDELICKGGPTHGELFKRVLNARRPGGQTDHDKIKHWIEHDTPAWQAVMAYCGIVTGIFDFDEIDDEEVLDTLEPTFSDSDTIIRIHRCTFIAIASDDRAMEECWPTVGISPYLLLPHSVILFNEHLVEQAEAQLEEALGPKGSDRQGKCLKWLVSGTIRQLEEKQTLVSRNLNSLYLPNLFNYITERTLYDRGLQSRGLIDKLAATRNRLAELDSRLETLWETRRFREQLIITYLLALLSILQARDVFVHCLGPWAVWVMLGIGLLVTGVVVRMWGTKRNK